MAYLDVNNLRVEYERGIPTLPDFSLAVTEGELVSLLGPSGCGKTTTLRTIAGFIEPVAGRIEIGARDCTRLPPNERDIGMVFQSYALFPHLTVFDNVAFGLRMRRVSKAEIHTRVQDVLKLVDLAGYDERKPAQLSGGQRQRVALARAIVIEPALLLFDEPLSNLDAKLRVSMRTEIRRLQQRLGVTALYVTHDQVEALAISDRVVVMNMGEIEQMGTPEEIFTTPRTAFVADFMGFSNKFGAHVTDTDADTITAKSQNYTFTIKKHNHAAPHGEVQVYFRPDGARLSTHAAQNSIPGDVALRTFQGNVTEYIVQTSLGEFVVHHSDDMPRFEAGEVHVILNARKLIPIQV